MAYIRLLPNNPLGHYSPATKCIFGLGCAILGLMLLLAPLLFGLDTWMLFYWVGGVLMVFGGFVMDATILVLLWPRFSLAWKHWADLSAQGHWTNG